MIENLINDINLIKVFFFLLLFFVFGFSYLKVSGGVISISKNVNFLFLLFVLILLHSLIFSFNRSLSVSESLYALLVLMSLFLFVKNFGCLKVLKYYEYLILIVAILLIVSSNAIIFLFNSPLFYADGNFHGVLQNSNTLALYLSVFISPYVFYSLWYKAKSQFEFWVLLFLSLDVFFIIVLTKSRTGIVIFLLSGLILYFSKYKLGKKKLFLAIVCLISACILGLSFQTNIQEIIYKNNNTLNMTATRDVLWKARLDAIDEKPYEGWGYAVNEHAHIDKYHIYNPKEKGNTVLAIIEEFGFLFGSFLLVCFAYLFYGSYQKLKNTRYKWMGVTVILAIAHSMLETWVLNFYSFLAMLFWLIVIVSYEWDLK